MKPVNWLYRVEGRVATLSLNRPDTGNNINLECLAELMSISEAIQSDAGIHAVVLKSEGKHFSVGMDVAVIQQMAGQPFDAYAEHLSAGQRCIDAFEAIQQPIVAEIRGFCIGAGVILAACADFRLSSARAVYSLPEVQRSIGVIMGLGRVTRIIGTAHTKRMAMLGEKFSAAEMQQMGFLTQVVPDEKLSAEVDILLKKILSLPPRAVALNKRIADFAASDALGHSQRFELEQQYHLNQTQDFKEAMQSFFEKRPPRYRGV
jgi:enoyl-CoA hydratase/carnithine racemase